MADPPYDDPLYVDAAVLLRLQARGAARERDLLDMDQPRLTSAELHASLERIRRRGGLSWYPDEGRVLAPHPFTLDFRSRPAEEQAALRRAWDDGNYWRGRDIRDTGSLDERPFRPRKTAGRWRSGDVPTT